MSEGITRRVLRLSLVAVLATAGLGVVEAQGRTVTAHRHAHVKKHRKKTKKKAVKATTTPAATCTAAQAGALTDALSAFWQHIQTAHLDQSPAQQIEAIVSDPDGYVKLHTVWIESMLDPSMQDVIDFPDVLSQVLALFWAHVDSAHLALSPVDQVKAILSSPDGYVKLHTVWVESMVQVVGDWETHYLAGSPASCSAGSGSPAPPAAAQDQTVMISGMAFSPAAITVPVGTKVMWMNHDTVAHTVTSTGSGPLHSPSLGEGGTYSYTFTQPGTYSYYCAVHPDMKGTVTVQ